MQKPTEPTSEQSVPLTQGRVLRSTYEIGVVLGKGGMGSVFLARHLRLPGKQVAIKVLHGAEGLTEDVTLRFKREAEIASRLGHPNIVEVLDFDTLEDGSPFMVMEYLRGEGLSRRLRRQKKLPLEDVLSFSRQMGSALQAAHRAGVVHRDLKPGNVFLVPMEAGGVVSERVKLLDFGISKLIDSSTLQTLDSVLMGTPQYMAPEQATGHNSVVDARTDVFAFGCIVYEMLAGKAAWGGENVAEIIYQIVHLEPEPLLTLAPQTPPHMASAILRAMAKKPEDRYPDVGSFILDLTGAPLQMLGEPKQDLKPTRKSAPVPNPPDAATHDQRPVRKPDPEPEQHVATVDIGPRAGPESLASRAQPLSPRPVTPGPHTQSLSEPASRSRAKGWWPVAAGGAILVAGLVAFLVAQGSKPPPPAVPAVTPPVAMDVPAPVDVKPAQPTDTQPPVDPTLKPVDPVDPRTALKPPPDQLEVPAPNTPSHNPTKPHRTRPSVDTETIPANVRDDLAAAQRALDAKNPSEALRHIRRSQRTKITGASFSLLTRVYCQQQDLANARAQWTQVPATERPRVRQYCLKYEIDL